MTDAEQMPPEPDLEIEQGADPDGTDAPDGERGRESEERDGRLAALVAERQRNRSEIADLRKDLADLRTNLSPAQKAEADAWQNPFDKDERPFDWLAAETEHTRSLVDQSNRRTRETEQELANRKAIDSFAKSCWAEIEGAGKTHPVVMEAYGHVEKIMKGLHGDDASMKLIEALARGASKGQDAPTVIAEIAMKTGFREEPKKPDPKARAAKAAQASLGGASGGTGSARVTAEQLAKLSRAEAAKPENREMLMKALRGEL